MPLRQLVAVPVDVGKSSAMVMACDFTRRRLMPATEFPLTGPGIAAMLARLGAVLPVDVWLVRVGVEAAEHYHQPMIAPGFWSESWQVVELNPAYATAHRDGPATADYLALIMLPFGEEQVRAYLAANLPGADVDRLLELIDSVHNLREIAERPLTLRMITEQLETVERAKLAGRTVRAVDLYESFVSQWLERDAGKHSLLPDHKELLMEHLAAEL